MTFMWKGRYVHMSRKDHPWNVFLGLGQNWSRGRPNRSHKNMENTHPSMAAAVFSRLERISVYSAHSWASTHMSTQQGRPQSFPAFHSFIALEEEHTIGFDPDWMTSTSNWKGVYFCPHTMVFELDVPMESVEKQTPSQLRSQFCFLV